MNTNILIFLSLLDKIMSTNENKASTNILFFLYYSVKLWVQMRTKRVQKLSIKWVRNECNSNFLVEKDKCLQNKYTTNKMPTKNEYKSSKTIKWEQQILMSHEVMPYLVPLHKHTVTPKSMSKH